MKQIGAYFEVACSLMFTCNYRNNVVCHYSTEYIQLEIKN